MTILKPKEVMRNVERSLGDTALTMKEVKKMFPFKRHHYVKPLQVCKRLLLAPVS